MSETSVGKYGATLSLNDKDFVEGMKKADKQWDSFTNDLDKKTDSSSKKMSGFGAGLGTLAAGAVAGLGVALLGAGVAGVTMATSLQGSLNDLQAKTGATKEEMAGMEQSLKDIYSAGYGESFGDIAESMALVKQTTGLTGDALEGLTKNAIMLRDTFGHDMQKSVESTKQMMDQFGISGDKAMALIAEGTQKGLNKSDDLLDTINEYSISFKNAGFDAEDMFAIMENASKAGVRNLDYVGDAMKEFGIIMKEDSDRAATALQGLGLPADKLIKQFAQGGEGAKKSFQTIITELGKIEDPLKRNQLGVELFGTKFEDLEADAVLAMGNLNGSIKGSKSTLESINNVKYDSFGGALKGIWRSLQTSLITPIQEHVLPLLNQFAQYIQAHMPQIQATISTIFTAIGTVIGGFINVVKGIITAFQNTSNSTNTTFTMIKTVIQNIMTNVGTIIQSTLQLIQALWQTYGQTIMAFITTSWNNILTIINGALKIIKGVIKVVLGVLTGDWKGAWEGIKSILSGALDIISGTIGQVFNAIGTVIKLALDTIGALFKSIWNGIVSLIKTVVSGIYNFLKDRFNSAKNLLSNILSGIKDVFSSIWNSIKSTVVDVATSIYSAVKGKFDSMKSRLSDIFSGIWSTAKSMFNRIKDVITNPIETAKNTVRNLINDIKGFFSNMKVNIPLPHFSASVDWKDVAGVNVPVPDIDVDWYKTGAYFNKASVIGVGEAGGEVVMPVENMKYMKPFAQAVARYLPGGSTNNQSINTTNNEEHFHFNNLTVKANNPQEFFDSLRTFKRQVHI